MISAKYEEEVSHDSDKPVMLVLKEKPPDQAKAWGSKMPQWQLAEATNEDAEDKADKEEADDTSQTSDEESKDVVPDVNNDISRMKRVLSSFSFSKEDTEFKPPKKASKGEI